MSGGRVEQLGLPRNNISRIPASIAGLSALQACPDFPTNHKHSRLTQVLNLAHNGVGKGGIAPELFALSELNTLDLSHNELTDLPAALAQLTTLIVLSAAHNAIPSIPAGILAKACPRAAAPVSRAAVHGPGVPGSESQLHIHAAAAAAPPREPAGLEPTPASNCDCNQVLLLAHNPLGLASLRAITTLKGLRLLDLSATERTEVDAATCTPRA